MDQVKAHTGFSFTSLPSQYGKINITSDKLGYVGVTPLILMLKANLLYRAIQVLKIRNYIIF